MSGLVSAGEGGWVLCLWWCVCGYPPTFIFDKKDKTQERRVAYSGISKETSLDYCRMFLQNHVALLSVKVTHPILKKSPKLQKNAVTCYMLHVTTGGGL